MGHLVAPITEERDVRVVLDEVEKAHGFLVKAAVATITQLQAVGSEEWGTSIKRRHVRLPKENRPARMEDAPEKHSFAEVVNQCATMERLLDALRWSHKALPGYMVKVCHPTTSASKAGANRDNDLILVGPDGELCCFEVSDVAASKDGNRKETKDLISLGVLDAEKKQLPWPAGRLFLVVSKEFWEHLSSRKRRVHKQRQFHYVQRDGGETSTRIIEVVEGRGMAT